MDLEHIREISTSPRFGQELPGVFAGCWWSVAQRFPILEGVNAVRAQTLKVLSALGSGTITPIERSRMVVLYWTAVGLGIISAGYLVWNVIVGSQVFLIQNALLLALCLSIVLQLGRGRVRQAISYGFIPGVFVLISFQLTALALSRDPMTLLLFLSGLLVVLAVAGGLICQRRRQFRVVIAGVLLALPAIPALRPALVLPDLPQASGVAVVVILGTGFAAAVFRLTRRANREMQLRDDLLREVHHRIRNETMVLVGLIDDDESRISDPAVTSALSRQKQRILAVLGTHEHLHQDDADSMVDLDRYLSDLARPYFRTRKPDEAPVTINLTPSGVRAPVTVASPIGLIVTELMANSTKHGFPAGCGGPCRVSISVVPDGRTLRISYTDNGAGAGSVEPDESSGGGFGLQFIRRLVSSLGGTFTSAMSNGYRADIVFPALDFERGTAEDGGPRSHGNRARHSVHRQYDAAG